MGLNPFCEVAIEAAMKFRERIKNVNLIALSIGPLDSQVLLF